MVAASAMAEHKEEFGCSSKERVGIARSDIYCPSDSIFPLRIECATGYARDASTPIIHK